MRVVASLMWRALFVAGLWLALGVPLALCVMGDESLGFFAGVAVLRGTAFALVTVLLLWEWRILRRTVAHWHDILADLRELPPGTPELGVLSTPVFLLTLVAFVVLLEVRAIWATGALATQAIAGGLAWTVATTHVVALMVGSITLWRTRRAVVRALGRPPAAADAWPGTTAVCSAAVLLLVFVRLPGLWIPRLAVGALTVGANGLAAIASDLEKAPPVELLVELGPDDEVREIAPLVTSYGGRVLKQAVPRATDPDLRATWVVEFPVLTFIPAFFALAADAENVDDIELNAVATSIPTEAFGACARARGLGVNDPFGQPAWESVGGAAALSALPWNHQPVTIAVIDTGIAPHEDLRGVLSDVFSSDRVGHGTAVGSVAAATANNGRGIASLNVGGQFLRLRSYPALAQGGDADEVAESIVNATADGARVIVMSFSGVGTPPKVVQRAVAEARARGVVLVAAAGNVPSRDAASVWPANVPGVVPVGATEGHRRAGYSSTTRAPGGLSAPGTVCAATVDGGYAEARGTSLAAPLVAGLIGTVWAICPRSRGDAVVEVVRRTAAPGPAGLGPEIRADAAVQAAVAACR